METIELTGDTGLTYEAEIHPMSKFGAFDDLENVEAVYMFVREGEKGEYQAIYIGETGDVNDRLREGHHKIDQIRRKKATHIFIYRDEDDPLLEDADTRRIIEDDLMCYRPECQPEKWPADSAPN